MRAFFLAAALAGLFSGCAQLSPSSPSSTLNDHSPPIYRDYDYNTSGAVMPYPVPTASHSSSR